MPLDEGYRKQAALLVRTVPLVGSRRRGHGRLRLLEPPPTVTIGSGPDTLALKVSEMSEGRNSRANWPPPSRKR